MKPYANLHTHSIHSDGKFSPRDLVRIAWEEGYRALAVTDHDTVTANPEVAACCRELGMEYIFGAEFTSGPFHIVALDFDPEYPEMKAYLEKMVARQQHETKTVLGWAQEKGALTGITWEDVVAHNRGISWLCNEHVFQTLKSKGLMTDLDYYDFYVTHFYQQRRQVTQLHDFLAPKDMIGLIRRAGGIPILAHPHGQLDRVEELISYGLLGIEVYHPDLTPQEQRQALAIAYEKGLFISGGTDHSGLCGGMYSSFDDPEESTYYLEPQSHGTLEEHFRELQNRKLSSREEIPSYTASHKHYR